MAEIKKAFSGFSVIDVDTTRAFYETHLACTSSTNEMGILSLDLPGGASVMAYPKPNHQPASFTILNFTTDDLPTLVDELAANGVSTERYEGFSQDERGISQNAGPLIAWVKDPSGNVLALLQA